MTFGCVDSCPVLTFGMVIPMNFDGTLADSIGFKSYLYTYELPKFAVRSMLAGMFLTIMTAFATVASTQVESSAPGYGRFVFAAIFCLSLYVIVVLGAELATGNMMFMTYGSASGRLPWLKGFLMVSTCTIFNLLGVLITAVFLVHATAFQPIGMDSFLAATVETKLAKPDSLLFMEGIFANIVVNIGVLLAIQAGKDFTAKFLAIMLIVPAFAAMGYEHSIASFVVFSLAGYGIGAEHFAGFTLTNGLMNWLIVWVGNYIGGGLIMGGVYAWLNRGNTPATPLASRR